jgi:exodeoxyribonuclease V alpha subunit
MILPNRKVKVLKRIFFSEENGFGVFKVSVKGTREHTIIVGNLFDVKEGDFLEISGDDTTHPKFGQQIKVKSFKSILPEDDEGIIKYLSSGRIKGIGKKTAEKIVGKFGSSTFNILQDNPEKLKEIRGLRNSIINEIKKNLEENRTIRELTVKLAPYGIGNETIFKIYKTYGVDSFEVLEKNAYSLIETVKGVGFKIADTIAQSFGTARNDVYRINAGIRFFISFYEQNNGNLYIEELELVEKCSALLAVDGEDIRGCINKLVETSEMVREKIPEKIISTFKTYSIEKTIAHDLFSLSNKDFFTPLHRINCEEVFKKSSVDLTTEQREAVASAVNNKITIITGGPGTGKTTIIRTIIEALEKEGKNVLIAAPTGRAAKRIEEATFYQASTIHRMLKINPETRKFVHNQQNPLRTDAIIIDEFSMVDFYIFYSLLKAISMHTRLIIIGDKDQLPSVGPGNVLRDIINSGYFNIIYLNRNFRQTEESLIIENAYRINGGQQLMFKPYSEELDFVYIKVMSESQAVEKVLRIIDYHKNDYNFNSLDMQVLSPMYRGEAGIDTINSRIQDRFNPESFLLKKDKFAFKQWDKVMQLKNNYEKEVFNGEQGIVSHYNSEMKLLIVNYDGKLVEYDHTELEEITLSYAVSVHKAQGSEYDVLILVLLPSHSIMLNRELFYTAVTRAKKKIFLISDEVTIQRAILNSAPSERKTLLPKRLKEVFEEG